MVVTQAGQLEGIRRGNTSTSPPALHHSARVVCCRSMSGPGGGVGLLIREGSVREPQRSHSHFFSSVVLTSLSPPQMFLPPFENSVCVCVCVCVCARACALPLP